MESIITTIPENIVPNTLIETSDNSSVSTVEFYNADLSLTKDQQELYDWKFATIDCFKDEFEDDNTEDYNAMFLKGYMTEDEAKMGHEAIVADILANGQSAESLQ